MGSPLFSFNKVAKVRAVSQRHPLLFKATLVSAVFLILVVLTAGFYAEELWRSLVQLPHHSIRFDASSAGAAQGRDSKGDAATAPRKDDSASAVLPFLGSPSDAPDLSGLQFSLQDRIRHTLTGEAPKPARDTAQAAPAATTGASNAAAPEEDIFAGLPPPDLNAFKSMGNRPAVLPPVQLPVRRNGPRVPQPPQPVNVELRVGRMLYRADPNIVQLLPPRTP